MTKLTKSKQSKKAEKAKARMEAQVKQASEFIQSLNLALSSVQNQINQGLQAVKVEQGLQGQPNITFVFDLAVSVHLPEERPEFMKLKKFADRNDVDKSVVEKMIANNTLEAIYSLTDEEKKAYRQRLKEAKEQGSENEPRLRKETYVNVAHFWELAKQSAEAKRLANIYPI